MRRTSTTFQPYDRATGTELSHQQQADCGYHYTVIKSYIDNIESQAETPIPWTRRKLRCSTAELLDWIENLADEIRHRQQAEIDKGKERGTVHAESSGKEGQLGSDSGVPADAAQTYRHAVNLLHELVSRLADVDEDLARYSSSGLLDGIARMSIGPASTSDSSVISSAFSNVAACRTSYITIGSAMTGSSKTSDELGQPHQATQKLSHKTEEPHFEMELHLGGEAPAYDGRKETATHDWVLEYLRGGWLANSPSTTAESTISPTSPQGNDTSPFGSVDPLRRTDSDEVSAYSENSAPRTFQSASNRTRTVKRGRPIPTMASRFKGGVASRVKGQTGNAGLYGTDARSTDSGLDRFNTPRSIMSGDTVYCTPNDGAGNIHSAAQTSNTSAWNAYLRRKGLIPNPFEEMDWSGRGQHAEFDAAEEAQIPLTPEIILGHSATALVESVRCRRIRLARKTVQVSRRLKKEEAIKEVEHLQRLKHSHILRVVGTYTLPRKLSILLYPVANYTLDQFLESTQDGLPTEDRATRLYSISTFLRCLAKAVAYIHENAMKHMDIKPKNLLIRDMHNSTICNQGKYKIYIADFGIARSYRSVEDCNTESPTAYTRTYAAPEVVAQERRDQKADIFSLGAVYAEMLAVLADPLSDGVSNCDALHSIREHNTTDHSYAAHAPKIQSWLRQLSLTTYGFENESNHSHITALVGLMLSIDPAKRPTANTIMSNIPFRAFCCDVNGGSEPFEAADRPAEMGLYDRAFEITEADLRYFRCMVEGCVKVYFSREKLEYHIMNGHGENTDMDLVSGGLADDAAQHSSELDAEISEGTEVPAVGGFHHDRTDWSTF